MRFIDTNILLYAVSTAPDEANKKAIARDLLNANDLALSTQVIGEFYTQATHRRRGSALTHTETVEFINFLLRYMRVQEITLALVRMSFEIHARFGLNYWDCAILAAARLSGCEAVYSEDLSHTQNYDGLRVINPFAEMP